VKGKGTVKLIDNPFVRLILAAGLLTSCNGPASESAEASTEVMVTASLTVQPTLTATALEKPVVRLPASPFPPTPIPFFTFPVDRHDPESVIRAYFDAWERSDSLAMASVLSSKFGQNFIFEPLDSMEVLNIELISDPSATERIYSVLYDAQWKDQPETNPTRWRFRLNWDPKRESWIIIGYGSG
jgi:hypothetical protein